MIKKIILLFITLFAAQVSASENLVIPIEGGKISPLGNLQLNLSRLSPFHDYSIQCDLHANTSPDQSSQFMVRDTSPHAILFLNRERIRRGYQFLSQNNNTLVITPVEGWDWIGGGSWVVIDNGGLNGITLDNCTATFIK